MQKMNKKKSTGYKYDGNVFVAWVLPFSIQSCRSCYATQHLCQRSFYKIFVKFRNSKNNINKDENKSLFSNQFFLENE